MTKKAYILLYIIMLSLLSSFAFAKEFPINYENIVGYWRLNETSGKVGAAAIGQHDLNFSNGLDTDWVQGVYGNAIQTDNVDSYLLNNNTNWTAKGIKTIAFWMNMTSVGSDDTIFSFGTNGTADERLEFNWKAAAPGDFNLISYYGGTAKANYRIANGSIPADNNFWINVVLTRNSSHYIVYINGTRTDAIEETDDFMPPNANGFCLGGKYIDPTGGGASVVLSSVSAVVFDEVVLSSETWTSTQALGFYNGNISEVTPPTITLIKPDDNHVNISENINFIYNVTSIHAGITNCSLYINHTINQTHLNPTNNSYNTFSNVYVGEGNWTWLVGCADNNNNQINTSSRNLTIQPYNIDNCSTYSTDWINFTLRDEVDKSLIQGNILYNFDYLGKNYSGSYSNKNNFGFCMSPTHANFTTDILLQYSASGYTTRDYITTGFVVDNVTDFVTIYLLSSINTTAITVHVVDDSDEDLSNVLVQAYRWDIATNSTELVETEYTDSDGNAILDLQLGTTYYSFKFYTNGNLRLSTDKFKIFDTTLEYTITDEETTRLEEWLQINNIVSSLTYSNSTDIITYTWNDGRSIADNFCLNVTASNGTSYHHSCSTSSTSSLTYTITKFNISYVAKGWARYGDSGNWYILETLSVDSKEGFRDYFGNTTALMIGFIIFIVIATLSLINKNIALVGSMFGVILLYFFGILPGITSLMGLITIGVILTVIINKEKI